MLVGVAAMLALGIFYTVVLVTFPSDGAAVSGPPPFHLDRGSIVLVPLARGQGLTVPVRLVAIQGRGMTEWLRAVIEPGAAQPHWHMGQTLAYTILRHGQRVRLLVTLGPYPLGSFLVRSWGTLTFAAAFLFVAAFVFARRPRDRVTLPLLLCASALFPASIGYYLGIPATLLTSAPRFWLYLAAAVFAHMVFLAALVHAALLFPRPHPLTLRFRWLIPIVYAAPAIFYLVFLTATWPGVSILTWFAGWATLGQAIFVMYLAAVVVVIVSAYQLHRDDATRQQIRWAVFGGVIAAGGTLVLSGLPVLVVGYGFGTVNLIGVLQTIFPITLAIAILRYRLFDIDVIINRTLVYGTLTGTLALVYFGSVVLLQLGFRALTGQSQPAAIVISTLAIAALFTPLRRRIQISIDRRFYRAKYDAARTIAAFSAQLRAEVDLAQLRDRLLGVVEETMRPAHASLWLADPLREPAQSEDQRSTTSPG
jgi:hypothetical protein